MASSEKQELITPQECIARLPEIPLEKAEREADDDLLRRTELRQAILDIAGLNHVNESSLVRNVVKNALGKLPDIEE
jgi:hypothetical protein